MARPRSLAQYPQRATASIVLRGGRSLVGFESKTWSQAQGQVTHTAGDNARSAQPASRPAC
ncbi:hypothetical protein J6590_099707 [Homalodisca vitripennis]|nr:hypothetical protein J6590_099707 [Homalodisca vitripennis]